MTSESTPRIAILLPAYNEALTIRETMLAFHAAIPEGVIHVIDNNSSDETASIAAAVLREHGIAGSVIGERRQGKGNALRRAFGAVDADVYLLSDADMTYPASRARELLQPVLDDTADMVVGDRHSAGHYAAQNRRAFHGFGNGLVRGLINVIFRSSLRDAMSGFRAFSRKFVKSYPVLVEGFEIEVDMTMHALDKRYRILEIPIEYADRPAGSVSKLNTLADGTRVLFTIAQILRYYRPLAFFGALAIVSALLGLLAGAPVIADWILYRFIYHVPLAILAASLEIVALLLLTMGLVLDGIAHQQRLLYELQLLTAPRKDA